MALDEDTIVRGIAAFVRHRAFQYKKGAYSAALEDIAREILNGDAMEALRHGELDDLIEKDRKTQRKWGRR